MRRIITGHNRREDVVFQLKGRQQDHLERMLVGYMRFGILTAEDLILSL